MGKKRCCFPDACFALLFQVRIPWRETGHDERPDIVCFEKAFRRTWYLLSIFIAIIYQSLIAISNDGFLFIFMSSWRARGLAWKEDVLPLCVHQTVLAEHGPFCQPCQEIPALDRVFISLTRGRVNNKRPPLTCLRRHAGAPLLPRLS